MSIFHGGERLRAAPQHICGFLVLHFPDERLSRNQALPDSPPDDEVVEFIEFGGVAHVILNGHAIASRCLLWPEILYGT
jgi:hypothetical protein